MCNFISIGRFCAPEEYILISDTEEGVVTLASHGAPQAPMVHIVNEYWGTNNYIDVS